MSIKKGIFLKHLEETFYSEERFEFQMCMYPPTSFDAQFGRYR